jgi:hypothetical protein
MFYSLLERFYGKMRAEGTFLEVNWIKTLETLIACEGDVDKAAKKLGVDVQRVYNQLSSVRQARKKAQTTVNIINNWMRDKHARKYVY